MVVRVEATHELKRFGLAFSRPRRGTSMSLDREKRGLETESPLELLLELGGKRVRMLDEMPFRWPLPLLWLCFLSCCSSFISLLCSSSLKVTEFLFFFGGPLASSSRDPLLFPFVRAGHGSRLPAWLRGILLFRCFSLSMIDCYRYGNGNQVGQKCRYCSGGGAERKLNHCLGCRIRYNDAEFLRSYVECVWLL